MGSGTTATEAAARSRLLSVESYAVFLDLTTGGNSARSRTEIQFSCREPGAATFADLDALTVREVVLNGTQADPKLAGNGRLILAGLAASNALTVDATVAISGSGTGLTQYTDPADGQRYVVANCFPTAAPSVFCCFDQPDLRAELTLIVTLPAGWTCVSNGKVLHRPADGAAGVWRFSSVAWMKPYEFTLCAGPYVTAPDVIAVTAEPAGVPAPDSPVLTRRCRPALAGSPGLAEIADTVRTALRYYERLLDVPCPYDKVDIVAVPELSSLAMQLPAVMYVSEELLQRAADPGDGHVPIVLAHEAAHLWFGCLVEGRWWDDLWLAEAMANYLSYTAATAVLHQPDAWAEFGMTGEASAFEADSMPAAQSVASPVDTAAHALTRPSAITYSKGTAVIRQLGAMIGADAMYAGLHEYLTSYAWSTASLADVVGCWTRASGRDLTRWADQWLLHPGTNTLRPEITVGPDGVITSLAVVQAPPSDPPGPLRTHQLTIGIYEPHGSRLACRRRISVTLSERWTHVPELTGSPKPAAVVLNDTGLTFAAIRLDPVSWHAMVSCAIDVGDPLAESVCWNSAWDMVRVAELDAAEFAALVARRITTGRPIIGLEQLLGRALTGADYYAAGPRRPAARQQLAAAGLTAAERAQPASRDQAILARGYAMCADSSAQLDLLRFWLDSRSLPPGLAVDLELRARILSTLAARDLATDDDLAAYAALDPVAGDTRTATWQAMRPDRAAKEVAWTAALAPGQSPRRALAHAQGVWVPGQEQVLVEFRERYFADALAAVGRHDARTAQRLARALYPATLADDATLTATDTALATMNPADPVRAVLAEQRTVLQRGISARARFASSGQSSG
jgi:aminopeptidase N